MKKSFRFSHCKTYLKRLVTQAIYLAGCWKSCTEFSQRLKRIPEIIAWKDLLLILEGWQTVHFPFSKIYYANDITIKPDTLIVATSDSEIKYIRKFNSTDPAEDEMVSVRWKLSKFHHQIPLAEQKYIARSSACFCKLALMGELWICTSLFLMIWVFLIHVTTHKNTRNKGFH